MVQTCPKIGSERTEIILPQVNGHNVYNGDEAVAYPTFVVDNMWHIDYKHPTITFKIDK